jgi:hypothetical protein
MKLTCVTAASVASLRTVAHTPRSLSLEQILNPVILFDSEIAIRACNCVFRGYIEEGIPPENVSEVSLQDGNRVRFINVPGLCLPESGRYR